MNFREFLNVVPKSAKVGALILAVLPMPIALVVGYQTADPGATVRLMFTFGAAALVFGVFLATWLLCVGFVYADARQRAMRAVLWVLVAALFPHLLGFLLYFVLRQPIAAICAHCGMTVSKYQRFCSWCGTAQVPTDSAQAPLTANPSLGANE